MLMFGRRLAPAPRMVRDNRHDSVHLFGAICPARGVGAAIIMAAVNIEAMNEHLKEIGTQVATGAHAVVILDGAGWHQRGKGLIVPDNLTLIFLPPYAPECRGTSAAAPMAAPPEVRVNSDPIPSSKVFFQAWIWLAWTPNRLDSSAIVPSSRIAASATFDLNSGPCFFRVLVMSHLRPSGRSKGRLSLSYLSSFRGPPQYSWISVCVAGLQTNRKCPPAARTASHIGWWENRSSPR